MNLGAKGENIYTDTVINIKALIESETFNDDILEYLNSVGEGNIPKTLKFKVNIPNRSDTIKIRYETADRDQGVTVLNRLSQLMQEMYSPQVQYFKNEYHVQINSTLNKIDHLKAIHSQLGARLTFWIQLVLFDINTEFYRDFLAENGMETTADTILWFGAIGLMDTDGSPKPALQKWDSIRNDK